MKRSITTRTAALLIAALFSLQGCETLSVVGGTVGAAAGLGAAHLLAEAQGRRGKMSRAQIDRLKKGYAISFALMGAAGGAAVGNSLHARLKEGGRREREAALAEAARSARPVRYSEPSDPSLRGEVRTVERYEDGLSGRKCVSVEDRLATGKEADTAFAKMCLDEASGEWKQVTV